MRAYASLAGDVGPIMEVRINGIRVGLVEVRATEPQDYVLPATGLVAGAKVDVVFTNDALIDGKDRNLFVSYVTDGSVYLVPSQPGVVYDGGAGDAAFDGQDTIAGQESMWYSGALRMIWPSAVTTDTREAGAARFLHQATFGPTRADISRLKAMGTSAWMDEQMALPAQPAVLNYVQGKIDQGPDFQPIGGSQYTPDWVGQKFWFSAATANDQLRKRVAFALHSIFVVSQVDNNLFHHARAYAAYLDTLDRMALGNFRALIEEVALSPAMGIYLSHMRNMKEDASANRLPDENFARELMQLFTIGLYELNADGTEKLDSNGQPIETYTNNDVMALAKVFSGFSWGMDDDQLTETNFRWGTPSTSTTGSSRADVRRMKPYPGMFSVAEKRLFIGTSQALVIPANTAPTDGVKMALDTLFNHPNVGPFLARQLIQRLVTSNPSPAYVGRVAQAFNNNGKNVRGDLAAVVRATLLDTEARDAPSTRFGKMREPVLRVANWLRAFGAQSASGEYRIAGELPGLGQQANYMPSVFGYFRPGYVPPNTALATAGMTSPEMQIVDESSVSQWINMVELMLREGIGWYGSNRDVTLALTTETALVATGPAALVEHLNLMLFAGKMSPGLRKNILDAMMGVNEIETGRDLLRAKVAVYAAMTSPEYLIQR